MLDQTLADISDSTDEEDAGYIGKTMTDIIHRESAHKLSAEKLLCIQTPGGQKFGYNTDDQRLLSFMPQLRRLYDSVMASDDPPVEATFARWANRPGFKLTKLGRRILDACKYFAVQEDEGRDWQNAYAHHQFHPVIALMLRAVTHWWRPICKWWDERPLAEGGPDTEAVDGLRQLVDFVRHTCRSQAFRNRLNDHEHKEKDNFRSACDYIIEQFERHARLLVLRIDLYFRPDAKGVGYSEAGDYAVTNYLRALRLGRVVPDYLGFIIKRENGITRGMHYHLMVFLDGHLHHSAYHLTERMGEAWMKRVGRDKGSYFNCYARNDYYRYNGLGLVHVSNKEKLLGIRIALWYMSKQDSELKVDDSKVKNFWRSWKVRGDSNRGAPRKNGDGMNMVRHVLGGERSRYPPSFEPLKNERASSMVSRPDVASS